jgi:hypothetical protein
MKRELHPDLLLPLKAQSKIEELGSLFRRRRRIRFVRGGKSKSPGQTVESPWQILNLLSKNCQHLPSKEL